MTAPEPTYLMISEDSFDLNSLNYDSDEEFTDEASLSRDYDDSPYSGGCLDGFFNSIESKLNTIGDPNPSNNLTNFMRNIKLKLQCLGETPSLSIPDSLISQSHDSAPAYIELEDPIFEIHTDQTFEILPDIDLPMPPLPNQSPAPQPTADSPAPAIINQPTTQDPIDFVAIIEECKKDESRRRNEARLITDKNAFAQVHLADLISEMENRVPGECETDDDFDALYALDEFVNTHSMSKQRRFNWLASQKSKPGFDSARHRATTRQSKKQNLLHAALLDLRSKALSGPDAKALYNDTIEDLKDTVNIINDPDLVPYITPDIVIANPPNNPPNNPPDPPAAPPAQAPAAAPIVDLDIKLPELTWSSQPLGDPATGIRVPFAWLASFFNDKIGVGTINNYRKETNSIVDARTDVEQHSKLLHGTTEFLYDYTSEVAYNTFFGTLRYLDKTNPEHRMTFKASSELIHQASTHATLGLHVDADETRERLARALHNITSVNVDRAHTDVLTVRDGTHIFLEGQKLAQQSKLQRVGLFHSSPLQTESTPTGIVSVKSNLHLFPQSRPRPNCTSTKSWRIGERAPPCSSRVGHT